MQQLNMGSHMLGSIIIKHSAERRLCTDGASGNAIYRGFFISAFLVASLRNFPSIQLTVAYCKAHIHVYTPENF